MFSLIFSHLLYPLCTLYGPCVYQKKALLLYFGRGILIVWYSENAARTPTFFGVEPFYIPKK